MLLKGFIRIGLIGAFLCGLNTALLSQLEKANRYFKENRYEDAIVQYNKVIKKDSSNTEAIEKIAYSYRKLKDYNNAEVFYAKATEVNPDEKANYLYYGQTLKNNNKVKEAKIQFEKFLAKDPENLIGKIMVKSCKDIADWEVEDKSYEVSLVENINSKNSDFCPLEYEGGIIFVSERGADLVNESRNNMTNKPYLSIFFAREDKQYNKAKRFTSQLNSFYHDGPVSISAEGKTIYFTRVEKKEQGKNYVNKLKIYYATLDGNRWKNITPVPYNSNEYSVAHPCISDDGEKLFFVSDMPGGYGGMDLYVATRKGQGWGAPTNLGSDVNTSENEVFPYFRKGKLFFSSTGHSGYGGLDIFSVLEKEQWKNPENLKAPLNSSKDDFGIYYKDDENGYFSSNRDGGVGSDDIYSFVWTDLSQRTYLSGLLEYEKLGSSGTTINLLDENDSIVATVVTDDNGKFKFDKLDVDRNYLLSVDATDNTFLEDAKLYLTNSNGEKVLLANRVEKGKFRFQALPYEHYDELQLLDEIDEEMVTVSVFGQVFDKLPGDYSEGMEVWVVDEAGNIIGKTVADKDGKFVFDKLSPDEQYIFQLANNDADLNLIIVDEEGEVLETPEKEDDGKFTYKRLGADENTMSSMDEGVDGKALGVYGQVYDKLPGDYSEGMEVWVMDEKGNIIDKAYTDKDGKFVFDKLSPDQQYLFQLANDDELNVVIVDEVGEVLQRPERSDDGKFVYAKLQGDENTMSSMNEGVDGKALGVYGQVYDKLPGDYSEGMEVWVMDEKGNIIDKAYTDKDGKFIFDKLSPDQQYLFQLANDDEALNVVIVDEVGEVLQKPERSDDGKFVYAKLQGDESSMSSMDEGVDEKALGVYGQVYDRLPGDYSEGMEVWVMDENGNIIDKAYTDKDGKFVFDKLSADNQYIFQLANSDNDLNLIITNEGGELLESAKRSADGKFIYDKLDAEENYITLINEIDEVIKIAEDKNFIIPNIFYAYESYQITKESARELDKLVQILKKNKGVGIEVSSHTDGKGTEEYNLSLSQKRANGVVRYIVSKGVSKNKIKAKGYGKSQPIAPNLLPNGEDNPNGRAKNRRTEFKVIKLK